MEASGRARETSPRSSFDVAVHPAALAIDGTRHTAHGAIGSTPSARPRYHWTMHVFTLRRFESGYELTGGRLSEPVVFHDAEPRHAELLVGFLSQNSASDTFGIKRC